MEGVREYILKHVNEEQYRADALINDAIKQNQNRISEQSQKNPKATRINLYEDDRQHFLKEQFGTQYMGKKQQQNQPAEEFRGNDMPKDSFKTDESMIGFNYNEKREKGISFKT